MPSYFLDSSALVKAYRREDGTQRVLDLINGPDTLVIARLAHVEVSSALVRRGRAAGIADAALDAVLEQLDREMRDSFVVIALTLQVLAQAVELSRRHALRAADAIQLACALRARERSSDEEVTMVGSDQELNAAARAEGFAIIDPALPQT